MNNIFKLLRLFILVLGTTFVTACNSTPGSVDSNTKKNMQYGATCKENEASKIVHNLYESFPLGEKKSVDNQLKDLLLKYFDNTMTNLLVKNSECENKTGNICNLDFGVLYFSQDPNISNFKICLSDSDDDIVEVIFNDYDEFQIVKYKMKMTLSGWRISDVKYQDDLSLLEILSRESNTIKN